MIELIHADLGYSHQTVLKDLSLKIKDHQVTMIIGPNGSGKSTLLKSLLGLLPVTSGSILIEGKSLKQMDQKTRATLISGLLQHHPVPALSVKSLVRHGRYTRASWPRGYDEMDEAKAEEAMKSMGIEKLSGRMVKTLSQGQMQKAWIAMVLAQDTDWVLLDEPNTALDYASFLEFSKIIARLKDQGKHVIMVVHDLAFALENADQLICLDQGNCVFDGTPEDFLNTDLSRSVFGLNIHPVSLDGKTRYLFDRIQDAP